MLDLHLLIVTGISSTKLNLECHFHTKLTSVSNRTSRITGKVKVHNIPTYTKTGKVKVHNIPTYTTTGKVRVHNIPTYTTIGKVKLHNIPTYKTIVKVKAVVHKLCYFYSNVSDMIVVFPLFTLNVSTISHSY